MVLQSGLATLVVKARPHEDGARLQPHVLAVVENFAVTIAAREIAAVLAVERVLFPERDDVGDEVASPNSGHVGEAEFGHRRDVDDSKENLRL